MTGSREAAADYYRTLTSLYRWYGASVHGWHYGLYDGDIDSHAASLARTNELLLAGLGDQGALLDVGCGEGGFAVSAAGRGFIVTGLTLCLEHVQLGRTHAASNGVVSKCRFLIADLDSLPFVPSSFDVVVNQETWCHSRSKPGYLRGVMRILRPGGVFRAVDLAIADGPPTPRTLRRYQAVREGFQVPSLVSPEQALHDLREAGFVDVAVSDLTPKVQRSALLILVFSAGPHLLTALRADRWLYGRDERVAGLYRRHVAACMAFNRGLRCGAFRYLSVTARKPDSSYDVS